MTNHTSAEVGSMLQHAISLCAARAVVRRGLKVQVNNLTKPVRERKALYAELRAKEDALTEQIEQLVPHLDPDDVAKLTAQYEPGRDR